MSKERMMWKTLSVGIGIILLMWGGSLRADENLFINPGFEINEDANGIPDGWAFAPCSWTGSKGTIEWDESVSYSNKYSVKITQTNDKGRMSISSRLIPAESSTTYFFTGWLKSEFPKESKGNTYFTINGYKNGKFVKEMRHTSIIKTTTDWTQYKSSANTGTAIDGLRIAGVIFGPGTIWIDDMSLGKQETKKSIPSTPQAGKPAPIVKDVINIGGFENNADNNVLGNNLVSELVLINIEKGNNHVKFNNPRDGWIYFAEKERNESIAKLDLIGASDKTTELILDRGESMRWLKAGKYTVSFRSDSSKGKFTVRSIPELIFRAHFFKRDNDYDSPADASYFLSQKKHGRDGMYLYYKDYLRDNIIRNYNTLIGPSELITDGRKGIQGMGMPSKKTLPQQFEYWKRAFKSPYSGIILDEFVPQVKRLSKKDSIQGGYTAGSGFRKDIFDAMYKLRDANKNHGAFYAYLGIPSTIETLENCRPLFDVLSKINGYVVLETYIWPDSDNPENPINKVLIERVVKLNKIFPDWLKKGIVCLCTMETWDKKSDIDMKVWLDIQMNIIANHPAYKGTYGITSWRTIHTKPETLEWFSSLIRHYGIEGNKSMLSNKYGYKLRLDYLKNSDFSNNLLNWKINSASPKSIKLRKIDQISFKRGYFPRNTNLLVMEKIEGKSNSIEQKIEKLQQGKLYSLQLQAYSPQAAGEVKVDYNIQIDIKDVKIIKTEKRIIRGDGINKICRNAVIIVFKALNKNALLTISDGDPVPSHPAVKELLFDTIKVQPFYSFKDSNNN